MNWNLENLYISSHKITLSLHDAVHLNLCLLYIQSLGCLIAFSLCRPVNSDTCLVLSDCLTVFSFLYFPFNFVKFHLYTPKSISLSAFLQAKRNEIEVRDYNKLCRAALYGQRENKRLIWGFIFSDAKFIVFVLTMFILET